MGCNKVHFDKVYKYKLIYVFEINDQKHEGLVKIGDTSFDTQTPIDQLSPNCTELNKAAKVRIDSYTGTAGIQYNLLHTELALKTIRYKNGTFAINAFRDYEVHKVLINSNIKKVKIDNTSGSEWFRVDKETAIKAIQAVKSNLENLSNTVVSKKTIPIVFRPEQKEAIEQTVEHFKKHDRMLWNAKMRFGKTLSALQVIRQCKFTKTIILTHRPVVNDGWYDDFGKIFPDDNYLYGSKTNGNTVEFLNSLGCKFVYFASIQDLRGSEAAGGRFDKNSDIFDTVWDCVIIDEAHEGTQTSLGAETIHAIVKESLHRTKVLSLSGTPFNIADQYENDAIYTWDYIMEQEAKSEWDKNHFGDSNPYAELPELHMYTYDLGDILHNQNYSTYEDKAFNFNEFFRTWTGDFIQDKAQMPEMAAIGDFVHEKDVISFLNLMTRTDPDNSYPFSTDECRDLFRHTLWMIPGVKEAKALKELMQKHPVFGCGQFDIVNVAGSDDEESADALNSVRRAIEEADKNGTYTVTLSCGKLTTGVTVKEWTAVFMLAGSFSTSAANYLQTIFRVQSPCNKNGKIKEVAYVFDFAPDRTLKMVTRAVSVSSKAGKTTSDDKTILGKFLNFCPVISVSGSRMQKYNAEKLLLQLKKAYAEKVVQNGFDDSHLYNDELLKLEDIDIEKFKKLKGIIGKSRKKDLGKDITVNDQGLTQEEYEKKERLSKKRKQDLTDEEKDFLEQTKKKNKLRREAISILRGISIRMPLLIFGADVDYDDVISLDRFVDLVDDSSWSEFMPKNVSKEFFKEFRKYYDEEVFIASGQRIRNIAREADTLLPTDRVKRITSLFSYFRNPDKETVLTPWRVVNLHLSETLGGYDFFDEEHRETLDTPRFVDQGKVTEETFSKVDCKILEINSKTGLYPLYVCYSLYRAKLNKLSHKQITSEIQKELWNDTIRNNVYIICKTPMAKQITQRTLAGYSDIKINAHYFDNLINQLEKKQQNFTNKVNQASYWNKGDTGMMKFDAVVGNPPYQVTAKDTSDKPVYNLFMDAAFELSDRVTFITPARFLFRAGKTPSEWNDKILNDPHFKVVCYKPNSTDIFPNVDIKGGLAITYRDASQDFGSIGLFVRYKELSSILTKVKNAKDFESIRVSIRSQNKFNLERLYEYYPVLKNKIGSKGKEKRLTTSIFNLSEIFNKRRTSDSQVEIYGLIRNERVSRFIDANFIEKHENLYKYKVILPKSNGSGELGETLSSPVIGKPGIGYTQSFISFGCYDTETEAVATLKYLKTKFVRCMLGTLKVTQDNNPETWDNVPLQDFTEQSDIDWLQPVEGIDKQLFKKYNLTVEEIVFIENKIKSMV